VLNNGGALSNFKHTFLCLIPKKKKPTRTSEFRPISLCNVIYKIITKVIASRLKLILPHDVFHVSQLRKYVSDPSHVIQRDEVQVRDNLTIETLPMRIEGREVKKLRGKEIPLVKVVWGGAAGESFTWELESKMLESYPELFE